ncbi:hypothetical protein [Nonomuraea angiospora]|uniref:hypothetical protein n=1 Tax=Nonomuraea angiospora TaxID=46172 RepID=UPI0029B554B0|nr:hypothetical protein [Nonomuraea angiospora]MDX3103203.1 hypothetical protein [Nonomuraea angiospora]
MVPAVAAAVSLAEEHGIRVLEPVVLNDSFNLRIHLRPAPVVARVPTVTALGRARPADALRGFPGELPYLGPVLDEPLRLLELLDGQVPPDVLARLRDAHAGLAERRGARAAGDAVDAPQGAAAARRGRRRPRGAGGVAPGPQRRHPLDRSP